MQKSVLLFFISMVFYSCSILGQQQTGSEEQKLLKEISKKLFIPRDVDSSCKSVFTIVTIQVRDARVSDALIFDSGCPATLQHAFSKTIGVLKSAAWHEIFPAAKGQQNYDIALPFGYLFQVDGCYDTSLTEDGIQRKLQAIREKKSQGSAVPSYQLKPVIKKFVGRTS
ncbi:hypothetical protein [Olivibacter domesticus]|uniref:Uncharacterized protein n=1 Tax=Olivibacter domesticus TaxID=407022 RepID=A0A1H7IP23_OLID1|nr:hypothetical protein [Olivibacter domesticus]SEK62495.1 hypothetical protein SAMN05661044_00723 [Olivibacter domesticus]